MDPLRVVTAACNLSGWLVACAGVAVVLAFFLGPEATAERLQAWHASGVLYAIAFALVSVAAGVAVARRRHWQNPHITAALGWLAVTSMGTIGIVAAASGIDPWGAEASHACASGTPPAALDVQFTLRPADPLEGLLEGPRYQEGPSIHGLWANATWVNMTAHWPEGDPTTLQWRATVFHADGSTASESSPTGRGTMLAWNVTSIDAKSLRLDVRPAEVLDEAVEVDVHFRIETATPCTG